MKKMIALLLACLVLAGCSDAYASINNANETVFSVAGTTMTRGDLYNYMQAQDGGYTAVNMAMENILNAKIEVTEEDTEAKLVEISKQMGQSVDEIKKTVLKGQEDYLKSTILSEKVIKVLKELNNIV